MLLLLWGAVAFGAEFTWAYAPLLIFSLAVSALGILASRGPSDTLRACRVLIAALGLVFATTAFQITPLPPPTVTILSPARNSEDYPKLYAQASLEDYDPSTAQQPARTLSVEPSRTALGLTFLAILSILLIASAAGFSGVRPTLFARWIVVLGALAALGELVEKTQTEELLHGFFVPRQPLVFHSAPFINRNHTAGFLAMTAALSLGHLASCVSLAWRNVKPDWRSRLLWLSTRGAAESVMTALAVLLMISAAVLTQSRSGLLCVFAITVLFATMVVRQRLSRRKKVLILAGIGAVLIAGAAIGGVNGVLERFASDPNGSGRPAIWRTAVDIVRKFPLTGTGLNTYGIAALPYQLDKDTIAIEAHNDYLQLAAEGGVLVGVPVIVAIAALVVLIRRRFAARADDTRTYWIRVGATIGLCAMALQSLVDFTLQMPGAAVMFVMLAALAIHRPWHNSQGA